MALPEITCPNCKSAVAGWIKDPCLFGCSYCYATYRIDDKDAWTPLPNLPRTIIDYSPEWLRPGVRMKRNNKVYTLASVYLSGVNWKEHTGESNNYESGYSEYLEWYLVAEDGDDFYIEETDSKTKFQIKDEIELTEPVIKKVNSTSKKDYYSPDYGTFNPLAFCGQDDEPLDRITWNYKVIQQGTSFQSVEWVSGAPTEAWKSYETRQVGLLELERWRMRPAEEIAEVEAQKERLGFYRDVFLAATFVLLALMVWSFITSNTHTTARSAWAWTAPASNLPDSVRFSGKFTRTMGKVKLEKDRAYSFNCDCRFNGSTDSESNFSIQLLRLPDGKPVNNIAASFYIESGRDNEGTWSESTLKDDFTFRADETAEYEIVARVLANNNGLLNSGDLIVTIKPVLLTRYFIIAFLFIALTWLICQWRWEYAAARLSDYNSLGWLQNLFGR